MFFNAMKRKNWDAKENDMSSIVPIHNAVNEKAWREICEWEAFSQCDPPKLLSFEGKPHKRTLKSYIREFLGFKPPFDRHDWMIDRCGTQVRYIIDFYSGQGPLAFYLDVRPAPSWQGFKTYFLHGIDKFKKYMKQSISQNNNNNT